MYGECVMGSFRSAFTKAFVKDTFKDFTAKNAAIKLLQYL